jgi:hypothetical protein
MAEVINVNISKRINTVRFLLIALIVVEHNTLFEVHFSWGIETLTIPEYVNIIRTLFSDIIVSSATPLFSIISSYLLYSKETRFLSVLKKKSKTIFLPYILWNTLSLLFFLIGQNTSFTKQYFSENFIKDFTAIDWIDVFIGKFTELREYQFPLVYQFHFLRDLYILSLLFLVIKKIVDKFPFGTISLFFIIWVGNINIYLVAPRVLFFFTVGYYVVKYSWDCKKIDQIKMYDILSVYTITVITRLFFNEKVPIIFNINVLVGVILFIKLTKYFVDNTKIYNALSGLSKYAFFVFATHGIALGIMQKISIKIIPMRNAWLLLQYFSGSIFVIIILVLIGTMLRKLLPKTYAVLTGGRIYKRQSVIPSATQTILHLE